MNEFALARLYVNQAITFFQQKRDNRALARAYYDASVIELNQGNYARALSNLRLAESLLDPETGTFLPGLLQAEIAMTSVFLGDWPAARLGYEKAIQTSKLAGHHRWLARLCSNLGYVLTLLGDWQRAKEVLTQALEISYQLGDQRGEGVAFNNLGKLFLLQGQTEQARSHLERAIAALIEAGEEWGCFEAFLHLSLLYLSTGETERADATAREALSLAQRLGHQDFIVRAHLAQAELELARKDFFACHKSLWAAEEGLAEDPALPILAAVRQMAGRLATAEADFEKARQLLSHSLSAFETLKDRYQIGISSLELGNALLAAGFNDEARTQTARALRIFTELGAEPARQRAAEAIARCASDRQLQPSDRSFLLPGAGYRRRATATEYPLKRLIDAACSEEMLLRELVAVSSDLAKAEEVVLFRLENDRTASALVHHGCSGDKVRRLELQVATTLAGDQWPLAGGQYAMGNDHSTLLLLSPKSQQERLALYLNASHGLPGAEEHRRLKLALKLVKQGLESYALRTRLSLAWQPGLTAPPELPTLRCLSAMPQLIVGGPVMRDLLTLVTAVCNSETPVLITGESGTGKELIARPSIWKAPGTTARSCPSTVRPSDERRLKASFSATSAAASPGR